MAQRLLVSLSTFTAKVRRKKIWSAWSFHYQAKFKPREIEDLLGVPWNELREALLDFDVESVLPSGLRDTGNAYQDNLK